MNEGKGRGSILHQPEQVKVTSYKRRRRGAQTVWLPSPQVIHRRSPEGFPYRDGSGILAQFSKFALQTPQQVVEIAHPGQHFGVCPACPVALLQFAHHLERGDDGLIEWS